MKAPKNFRPEPYAYHAEIELEIEGLTNLGSGIGRDGQWVIFVPYALPGERVRVRIWRNKKNYSDGDLVAVLRASPERVTPQCALFGECGGCQYQHYAHAAQLEWKTVQVRDLLKKMTGREFAVSRCMGSAVTYGYRSKITPHFRKPPHIAGTAIGFQGARTRAVVDVAQCPIASPAINAALEAERARLRAKAVYKRGGTLLMRDTDEGVVTDNRARVYSSVGAYRFAFQAGEFFQNNPHVLPIMLDYVVGQARGAEVERLVDAYCGVGVFGIWGSAHFETVTGIEVNEAAVKMALQNVEDNGVANMRVVLGDAARIFAELGEDGARTAVIMDPPRRGSDPQFLEQLVAFGARRVVYVSCGPDTQARDLNYLLAQGYEVEAVQPFDLFPQTRHIENVVTLRRGA